MAADKFSNGAFTFFRTTPLCTPMLPSEIARLAQAHNLPPTCIPVYAGDRAVVSRAIQATSTKVSKQGWLLRPLKQSKHAVSYGIVKEDKDRDATSLDYHHEAGLFWCDENGNGHTIEGQHWIAQEADQAYQSLRERIDRPDWTQTISTYLVDTCQAQPLREDGRIWWLAPSYLPRARQLQAFLQDVGIQLVLAEVESEAVTVVRDAAQETLAEQLDALQAQVAQFDGKQKPSNYRERITEIVALKAKANAYKAALGIGVEQAQAMLDQLETQVRGMLDIRQSTVVHRSGRTSASGTPGSQPVDTLAQSFGATPNPYPYTTRQAHHEAGVMAQGDTIPTLQPSVVTSWAQPTFSW